MVTGSADPDRLEKAASVPPDIEGGASREVLIVVSYSVSRRGSELCLDADLPEVLNVGIEAGWHIALSAPTAIEVAIASSFDYERYSLRLVWPEYPEEPPSIVCFDPLTGVVEVQSAWPSVHWIPARRRLGSLPSAVTRGLRGSSGVEK